MVEDAGLSSVGAERECLFTSDHPPRPAAGSSRLCLDSVWTCAVISYHGDSEIFNGRDSFPQDSARHGRCRWSASGTEGEWGSHLCHEELEQ